MRVEANGLNFEVIDEGEGQPVVLLHGFPDSSYLWRHQIPALTGAGYRVIAPDLRGFGQSDKPEGAENYALPLLIGDVMAILDQRGVDRFRLVGHDWGSALAWGVAGFFGDRVEKLVAVSVGHPSAFGDAPIEQTEKSWYFLFFQWPGVAESALTRNDWRLFREWSREQGDFDRYLEDLARPGALTAGINWYRANITPESIGADDSLGLPPAACPTLGIWSTGDAYLTEHQMATSDRFVTGSWRYERIEGTSHWIPVDAPDTLNRLLLDFL